MPRDERQWNKFFDQLQVDYYQFGQTDYDTGVGGFFGFHQGVPKLSLGDSAGQKVTYANGVLTIVGTITATAGAIGGWTLAATYLTSGSGANTVRLDSAGTNPAISAGSATPASAPFRVTQAGSLFASSATITGTITSTAGAIGGWTLGATSLTSGSGATTVGVDSGGTNPAFYAGSATPGSAPFRVTQAGALVAASAVITGTLSHASTNVTTVTPTFTGFSSDPSLTFQFTTNGGQGIIAPVSAGSVTGTSNSTSFSFTNDVNLGNGLFTTRSLPFMAVDNGNDILAVMEIASGGGCTLYAFNGTTFSSAGWTNSGTKGFKQYTPIVFYRPSWMWA